MAPRTLLALEFVFLCIALPTVIIVFRLAPYMFFFLWSAWAFCWWVYRRQFHRELPVLWRWQAVNRKHMIPILARWALCCLLMYLFTLWYAPDKLFNIPRNRPEIIPFLMVFYPIFSALPQEFIFCTYFFDRYKPLFESNRVRVWASALVFAYAHVLFINPVAPPLSFIAGLIFAGTYARTRSLALVTIEHALYGLALFIIGLGWYFWAGALV